MISCMATFGFLSIYSYILENNYYSKNGSKPQKKKPKRKIAQLKEEQAPNPRLYEYNNATKKKPFCSLLTASHFTFLAIVTVLNPDLLIIYDMGKTAADEKILSYNDVVLRQIDLDILSGPYYLNDRIIEFYFSYLSSCHESRDVFLVPPSIAFWIINCPDVEGLKDFVEPLKLLEKELVIFPVNDNVDVSLAGGGNHWSLLAYERNANVFVHHDSNHGMNGMQARKLFRAVVGYIGDSDVASKAKYVECTDSPLQMNGYDCGVYVTAIGRAICSWYKSSEQKNNTQGLWFSTVKEQVTPSAVTEMREEILRLIRGLMEKK